MEEKFAVFIGSGKGGSGDRPRRSRSVALVSILQLTVIRSKRHIGGGWTPLRNSSGRQKALFTCMRGRPSLREGGQVFRRCLAPQGQDWTKKPPRVASVAAHSPDSAPHWQHTWAGRARYPYSKLGSVEGAPLAKVLRFPSGANS
jgi:hypothetical protein